ncbi:MAG TPA: hypothetical protein VHN79_10215, partial [Lacunisphaera sp.]|nr:hypothetical protein [Lacunisphaera sp.]
YVNRWRYTPQKEGRVTAVHEEPGFVRVDSFHRNYEPALCRRSLVLVGDKLLAVIDTVSGLTPDNTVQIYHHLDSTRVSWDAARRCAVTADNEVNVAIHAGPGLQAELLPGRVSERPDVARTSTRLKLADDGSGKTRTYLTVLAPWRAGQPEPVVESLSVASDQNAVGLVCDGVQYCFPVPV